MKSPPLWANFGSPQLSNRTIMSLHSGNNPSQMCALLITFSIRSASLGGNYMIEIKCGEGGENNVPRQFYCRASKVCRWFSSRAVYLFMLRAVCILIPGWLNWKGEMQMWLLCFRDIDRARDPVCVKTQHNRSSQCCNLTLYKGKLSNRKLFFRGKNNFLPFHTSAVAIPCSR